MKQNKSLFIFNDFPPILGGQSTYFYYLCKGLPREKFVILAPAWKGDGEFDRNETFDVVRRRYVTSIPLLEKLIKIVCPFLYALRICRRHDIRMIHCGHVLSTGVVGYLLKKILKKPYCVYTFASDILEFQKYPPLKKLLIVVLQNADYIMTISRYTKGELEKLNVDSRKIVVVFPRLDVEKFSFQANTQFIKEKFDLEGRRVVLSVNRLVKRKGNDTVIKAMVKVKEKFPNALYVIIGDGEYESELKRLVSDHGLENHVRFLPSAVFKGREEEFYSVCDCFVMASRVLEDKGDAEGFGIVFLEANACSRPVIGGRSGGIPDAVVDEETGLLVNPRDTDAVASAVIRLLADAALRDKLGRQGRERVVKEFDYRNGVKELEALL